MVIVDTLTNNVNRTAADVRAAFGKNGGNMGVTGAVSYMFDNTALFGFAGDDADEILEYLMDKDDPSKMIAAQIEIRNISATPLSLERYVFNGVERVISPYRLPPAAQFPDAYYYINLPSVNQMDYASFTLHFEDTTQRKWKVPGRAEFKSGTWELSWEKPQKI